MGNSTQYSVMTYMGKESKKKSGYMHICTGLPCSLRRQRMPETQVRSLDREYLLKKDMSPHCSILAWRIPWTKELGGL